MNRARYLLRNINLLNIMLTGVLIFLVNYMLLPFLNKSIQYSLPVIAKNVEIDSGNDKIQDQEKTSSPLDYMIISERNLFHPERKIPVEVNAASEAQPIPKPDFVLYGTLLTDDLKIAYMEDKKSPHITPGREKRQTPLKQGETMSGFTLKEISKDEVIMVRGEERLTVYLIDPKQPKERVATMPAPALPRVIHLKHHLFRLLILRRPLNRQLHRFGQKLRQRLLLRKLGMLQNRNLWISSRAADLAADLKDSPLFKTARHASET